MSADVTVVIVSWNTRDELAGCLTALAEGSAGVATEVVVVDNGSADGSPAMVRAAFPGVRVIDNGVNAGFGAASNTGAAAGAARAVLLLNSDCELRPGALGAMLRVLDGDSRVGAVFCRLLNRDGTLQPSVHRRLPTPWSHAGDIVFASSLRYALYRSVRLKRWLLGATLAQHAAAHDVAWGGAACVLVRRAAFEAVGGFDERFFMYSEDVDLCARLAAAGYRLRYVPDAVAVHGWGASTVQRPAAMLEHAYRSRVAYFAKHRPGAGAALARGLSVLELGVRSVVFALASMVPGAGAPFRARTAANVACLKRLLTGARP